MFNSVNYPFTNQISIEFLDLIDTNFIKNNDSNSTKRGDNEQEQQIATSPTTTTEYYTFIPTEIYENENDNSNCLRFNPTTQKTHTFWPREDMYDSNQNSFYETNNNDLLERIDIVKKGLIGSLLFVSSLKIFSILE
jgi:hypothetical protein